MPTNPSKRGIWSAVLLSALLMASVAAATEYDPASRIQRPPGQGPTYVVVTGSGGLLADGDQIRPGYSMTVILRPHRAADFNHALYAWNTALVLQIDKQGGGPARLLSGDFVLRHYFADMRPVSGGRAGFLGFGVGLSHASWQTARSSPSRVETGSADAFTFLVEAGAEWNLDPALVLVGRGQYRLYNRGGHDLSGWSVHVGAGLPFPF